MENELRRLIEKRDRLCDDLQILEMQMGYRYMLASAQYQKYLDLETQCEEMQLEIAKDRATD